MTIRILAVVSAALLLVQLSAQAQGWRVDTAPGLEPARYLRVEAQERSARLEVWCWGTAPGTTVALLGHRGIFDYLPSTNRVYMGARFLPDSTIESTQWDAYVHSGEANVAAVSNDWGATTLEELREGGRGNERFVARLLKTTALQLELKIYGGRSEVATFTIPNHAVLEAFTASCQKQDEQAARQVPTGNEVFMEAIVEEKPAVLSGPTLQFPELLRQAQIQGRVLVQAIIDTLGRAEPPSVKVLQSPNPGFDQSAKSYVLKALFRPARVHDRAVRVLMQIPIDFRLR